MNRETQALRVRPFRHAYLVAIALGGLWWWGRYVEWAWIRLVFQPFEPSAKWQQGPVAYGIRWIRKYDYDQYYGPDEEAFWGVQRLGSLWGVNYPMTWGFAIVLVPVLIAAGFLFVGRRRRFDACVNERRSGLLAIAVASVFVGLSLTCVGMAVTNRIFLETQTSLPLTRSAWVVFGFAAVMALGFATLAYLFSIPRGRYWHAERISLMVMCLGFCAWLAGWVATSEEFHYDMNWPFCFDMNVVHVCWFTGSTAVLWSAAVRFVLLSRLAGHVAGQRSLF